MLLPVQVTFRNIEDSAGLEEMMQGGGGTPAARRIQQTLSCAN
jgi:hypothetical protein